MLQLMMKHVKALEDLIKEVEQDIETHIEPYYAQINLLKTIPGVKNQTATAILAEIGPDMSQCRAKNVV